MKKDNKCKLTKRVVESIKPDLSKRLSVWDTEVKGFCVRIYPSGKKTYFLQYRNKEKITRKIKLGVHDSNTTTEIARDKAYNLSIRINQGEDPSQEDSYTMDELASEYLKNHAKIKKAPQSYIDDKRFIDQIINKKYGNMQVRDITSYDLQKLHSELKDTPYKANHLRALLSKMFNLAIRWGRCSENPASYIEKYKEYKRHRWLNEEELSRLLVVLNEYHNQSLSNVIRLLLLTGARRNEVLRATWDQFDLASGFWTKPAHTTKQKKWSIYPYLLKHLKYSEL